MPVPSPQQITTALQPFDWPRPAVDTVVSLVGASGFAGVIQPSEAQTLVEQSGMPLESVMLGLCRVASLYAQVPISNFYVGAVARGTSEALYFGCNMEYDGQPLSFCSHGEQGAVANAWAHGETGLLSIAVNAAPCGYCRQYLNETVSAQTLHIILAGGTTPLTELLPLAFGPRDLGIEGGLLAPQSNGLTLAVRTNDPAVQAGLAAANLCYAPYTKSYSGIGLRMSDGATFGGPLSENAAYNPSQSPLEAALFLMNIAGYGYADIAEVALVEIEAPKTSQLDACEAVLSAVRSDLAIKYVPAR